MGAGFLIYGAGGVGSLITTVAAASASGVGALFDIPLIIVAALWLIMQTKK